MCEAVTTTVTRSRKPPCDVSYRAVTEQHISNITREQFVYAVSACIVAGTLVSLSVASIGRLLSSAASSQ
jgi:hypothetical protein